MSQILVSAIFSVVFLGSFFFLANYNKYSKFNHNVLIVTYSLITILTILVSVNAYNYLENTVKPMDENYEKILDFAYVDIPTTVNNYSLEVDLTKDYLTKLDKPLNITDQKEIADKQLELETNLDNAFQFETYPFAIAFVGIVSVFFGAVVLTFSFKQRSKYLKEHGEM